MILLSFGHVLPNQVKVSNHSKRKDRVEVKIGVRATERVCSGFE